MLVKKAKLIEVLYSGVPSWNVYGVHSAVSGMEAKPAMQSGAVGHKGLQCNEMHANVVLATMACPSLSCAVSILL